VWAVESVDLKVRVVSYASRECGERGRKENLISLFI